MNKTASHLLLKITAKEVEALTEGDISFLKARKSYLQPDDLEKFESVLSGKAKEVKVASVDPEVELPKYKDLIARGKELGLKVKIGMKREVIQEMITQAEL